MCTMPSLLDISNLKSCNLASQLMQRREVGLHKYLDIVSGHILMGFHHEPTESDMERMEAWFNSHVLHGNGIMHKTAHFEWDEFR